MFYRFKVVYRTSDGRYETVDCDAKLGEFLRGRAFIFEWSLAHLPESSQIVGYRLQWSKLPSASFVLKRIQEVVL